MQLAKQFSSSTQINFHKESNNEMMIIVVRAPSCCPRSSFSWAVFSWIEIPSTSWTPITSWPRSVWPAVVSDLCQQHRVTLDQDRE